MYDLIYLHKKALPENLVAFFGSQLILMLEIIHQFDFVYRDLKLENVLLDSSGYLRLIDFGLSHPHSPTQRIKSFSGTPMYLGSLAGKYSLRCFLIIFLPAPETLSTTGHGKEVDYWSLGVLLFILLTLDVPPSPFLFSHFI